MKYSVALARAKEFSIERNKLVMIAKAKGNNDCVILFEGEAPTKNYEIIETVEITNNFECVLQEDDICNSVIKTECRGVFCKHYNSCDWCKTKDCDNCKNRKSQ